ncbi:PDZ domain-containing protein [Aureibaculum sp. A20]|uniref:Tricorn protease homolog n=1 Tax=Aureibaculum flavum TaxID=2795986 RepID=A0ABS0WVB0_9FLAO|nr:S41 family peptidase [Aureibaculum flavum]MBJ2175773.1 PDZ domain-containing protein [Aureibaculum flavum]
MKNLLQLPLFIIVVLGAVLSSYAQQTKLMTNPALSDKHIAFVYAEDLWVANRDGSEPRRLTIDHGIESNPVFSPDGTMIAFNAEYDGNSDVFIIPSSGGVPKRLTYHPYSELVRDFTPDGKSVLFISQRNTHTNRFAQLYTIPINGGQVTELPIPTAYHASYADDGKSIAYTPLSEAFTQWKHYRGGRVSRIWLYDTTSHKVEEIAKPEGGSNDTKPQWMNNVVYFKSDRKGEFNLYSYQTTTKEIKQLTDYKDFPVLDISAHNGAVIFEQAGLLHLYDVSSNKVNTLTINISTDLLELRPRFVSGSDYIRSLSISPSGARVVADFRGEIVTVPANKGDVKNLTNTAGTHEKFPEWSPNGKFIAYFSDDSGEYGLHIQNIKTNTITKIPLSGTGFYANIHWSPDSDKLCFIDNGRNLYVAETSNKKVVKIAQDDRFVPGDLRELFGSWSHDSNWVSYTKVIETSFEQAFLYSIESNKSYAVSDGLSSVSEPIFDPSGKYLYMLASTDAGPVVNWFDQSNIDMEMNYSIYLVTLQKEVVSPLAKENDVEEIAVAVEEESTKGKDKKGKKEKEAEPVLKIDWEGLQQRIISLPIGKGYYHNLQSPTEGELYYVASSYHSDKSSLQKFDFKDRASKELFEAGDFQISTNGKKMLYQNKGAWFVADIGEKAKEAPVNFGAISVKINPKEEWLNIFNEAWRVNRDYFYDPNMHGADWNAMKEKYKPFIEYASTKGDVYRVMEWMFSEIAVGHHRFSSRGDHLNSSERIQGGLLGADYQISNNRYQIKKIYGGLNWTPDLRSPLTEPGVNVEEGDYIIAVNGKNITSDANFYSFFENTANKITELTISKTANGSNARVVNVTPIAYDLDLRNREWVEGNIKKVDKATNGQVAYVYVPNTAGAGHEYFKRYFFPQATKKAIIIDERYNGGGSLADYYIDILKRPEQAYWNFRYGKDLKSPSASIQGPKVMITDETAGSGGDYLPWMFRKFKLGTIVGKRTWGGLVGVLGYPEFIDGGIVTAPNVAFYTKDGFRVENEGVAPDIEVEQLPELIVKGHDPQLEKAIEVALEQLKQNPPEEMQTPAYPNKVKN